MSVVCSDLISFVIVSSLDRGEVFSFGQRLSDFGRVDLNPRLVDVFAGAKVAAVQCVSAPLAVCVLTRTGQVFQLDALARNFVKLAAALPAPPFPPGLRSPPRMLFRHASAFPQVTKIACSGGTSSVSPRAAALTADGDVLLWALPASWNDLPHAGDPADVTGAFDAGSSVPGGTDPSVGRERKRETGRRREKPRMVKELSLAHLRVCDLSISDEYLAAVTSDGDVFVVGASPDLAIATPPLPPQSSASPTACSCVAPFRSLSPACSHECNVRARRLHGVTSAHKVAAARRHIILTQVAHRPPPVREHTAPDAAHLALPSLAWETGPDTAVCAKSGRVRVPALQRLLEHRISASLSPLAAVQTLKLAYAMRSWPLVSFCCAFVLLNPRLLLPRAFADLSIDELRELEFVGQCLAPTSASRCSSFRSHFAGLPVLVRQRPLQPSQNVQSPTASSTRGCWTLEWDGGSCEFSVPRPRPALCAGSLLQTEGDPLQPAEPVPVEAARIALAVSALQSPKAVRTRARAVRKKLTQIEGLEQKQRYNQFASGEVTAPPAFVLSLGDKPLKASCVFVPDAAQLEKLHCKPRLLHELACLETHPLFSFSDSPSSQPSPCAQPEQRREETKGVYASPDPNISDNLLSGEPSAQSLTRGVFSALPVRTLHMAGFDDNVSTSRATDSVSVSSPLHTEQTVTNDTTRTSSRPPCPRKSFAEIQREQQTEELQQLPRKPGGPSPSKHHTNAMASSARGVDEARKAAWCSATPSPPSVSPSPIGAAPSVVSLLAIQAEQERNASDASAAARSASGSAPSVVSFASPPSGAVGSPVAASRSPMSFAPQLPVASAVPRPLNRVHLHPHSHLHSHSRPDREQCTGADEPSRISLLEFMPSLIVSGRKPVRSAPHTSVWGIPSAAVLSPACTSIRPPPGSGLLYMSRSSLSESTTPLLTSASSTSGAEWMSQTPATSLCSRSPAAAPPAMMPTDVSLRLATPSSASMRMRDIQREEELDGGRTKVVSLLGEVRRTQWGGGAAAVRSTDRSPIARPAAPVPSLVYVQDSEYAALLQQQEEERLRLWQQQNQTLKQKRPNERRKHRSQGAYISAARKRHPKSSNAPHAESQTSLSPTADRTLDSIL